MDIWFWITVGLVAAALLFGLVPAMKGGVRLPSLGSLSREMAPVLLLGGLGAFALLLIVVFAGNDGLFLVIGVPLLIVAIGLVAWRLRR